jgi:hypothetical protein
MAKWVVIVPRKSFTKCYGLFASHDLAMAWVRANQFDPEDVQIYPVDHDEALGGEQ